MGPTNEDVKNFQRRPTWVRTAEDAEFCEQFEVMGIRIHCLSTEEVLRRMFHLIADDEPHRIHIVNTATLNLAYANSIYRAVLNRGDLVLNDGTGVRWAARKQGVRLPDNNVGTDLIPKLCARSAPRGLRFFLLGGGAETVERAGQTLQQRFPGINVVGMRHGYFLPSEEREICNEIVRLEPDVTLVGLGNPLQELWIDRHLDSLKHGIVIGVGGLFDHLAANLRRAPLWMRHAGCEWVHILLQQPYKWRRYLLGNPLFLYRLWFGQTQGSK
jgi:N-acetylglucosaminyldiphosphoundecaprenol N-acetyl-beta-D-mannosaminyltransferase